MTIQFIGLVEIGTAMLIAFMQDQINKKVRKIPFLSRLAALIF